jgi:prepilin-type N-terminal cleavage/methylation domain-containing protein
MNKQTTSTRGFSLIEMLVSVAIFTVVMSAVMALMIGTQQRYQNESSLMDTMQAARQSMELMERDIRLAGYPPANAFTPAVGQANPQNIGLPFAWSPAYPAVPCTVGATCSATGGPAPFDLIIETDVDPLANNGVEWVRYRLIGTTLERGQATKVAGADPELTTRPVMIEYVQNVVNNAPAAQMNALQFFYPAMFPGNQPVPVFTYQFDAGVPNLPGNIRSVNITLIVQSSTPDPKNRQPRLVTLTGFARRFNP